MTTELRNLSLSLSLSATEHRQLYVGLGRLVVPLSEVGPQVRYTSTAVDGGL